MLLAVQSPYKRISCSMRRYVRKGMAMPTMLSNSPEVSYIPGPVSGITDSQPPAYFPLWYDTRDRFFIFNIHSPSTHGPSRAFCGRKYHSVYTRVSFSMDSPPQKLLRSESPFISLDPGGVGEWGIMGKGIGGGGLVLDPAYVHLFEISYLGIFFHAFLQSPPPTPEGGLNSKIQLLKACEMMGKGERKKPPKGGIVRGGGGGSLLSIPHPSSSIPRYLPYSLHLLFTPPS